MALALSYGEVFRLLAALHEVDPEKHTAFRGRLQHLQRLGFPPGVNTGRGRAVSYSSGNVLLLALALELIQLGLTPERAVRVLLENIYLVRAATLAEVETERYHRKRDSYVYLKLDPWGLQGLRLRRSQDEASMSFFYYRWSDLRRELDVRGTGQDTRLSLINLTNVVSDIEFGLESSVGSQDMSPLPGDLKKWAELGGGL